MSEFYVGYLPKAPAALGRLMRRVVIGLVGVTVIVSLLLIAGQFPFADSRFEYLQYRDYKGVVSDEPYPNLLTSDGRYLLVAPGKHGAEALIQGLDRRGVTLQGSLIQRGQDKMLELAPGSIRPTGETATVTSTADLGSVTLTGEIADSKCYLGVMNPGNGKVHRDCAVRCISGGIPPAFIVRDAAGKMRVLLLTGADGRKLGRETRQVVAEPIQITGRLVRLGDNLILRAEPSGFRRNP